MTTLTGGINKVEINKLSFYATKSQSYQITSWHGGPRCSKILQGDSPGLSQAMVVPFIG